MLRVTADEHRINFRTIKNSRDVLENASKSNTEIKDSVGLLLSFYAVEVGFKYLLSSKEKVPFKHEKKPGDVDWVEKYSHDLPGIVAKLKIPAARLPPLPPGPFNCTVNPQTFNLSQAHEAWRYGLTIDQADQTALKECMEKLTSYLIQEVPE
ncbi:MULTISPECIES: hypothetical protein [Serratia]|uniref:hypothetical protein n=1 Tax=Serratia TaxID=613 RepID=UPI0015612B05|nr:hypothetical protein [Serratia marcescens]NRN20939.1 hypothetical protein [Serratia marcescens]NRN25685.1 hypothetical protein [Serratia marcescens]NRN57135.1 hypothetical protein [Serratia marcescens]WJD88100.1 hypothetical protein QRD25_00390 [Serratia marcescens]